MSIADFGQFISVVIISFLVGASFRTAFDDRDYMKAFYLLVAVLAGVFVSAHYNG